MKKLLVLVVVLGIFVFTACSDDEGGGAGQVTEKLETSLIKVVAVTRDLGVVDNGITLDLAFKITNKTAEETVLKLTGGSGVSEVTHGACIEDFNPPTVTIAGNQTCDATVRFLVDRDNKEGVSPVTLFYEDANNETLSIVLARFTIKPVQ